MGVSSLGLAFRELRGSAGGDPGLPSWAGPVLPPSIPWAVTGLSGGSECQAELHRPCVSLGVSQVVGGDPQTLQS